jgi:hypothetical protein
MKISQARRNPLHGTDDMTAEITNEAMARSVGPMAAPSYDRLREEWAYTVGLQAYVWGYPLVSNVNRFDRASTVDRLVIADDTMPRSPINQICFLTHHARPDERAIVAPNVDTLYGSAWLNLGTEPIVLRIPEMGEQFWTFEMCDFYTNVFASPGTRRRSLPGLYLIAGPGWEGAVPAGIVEVLRAPTRRVYLLPRVLARANEVDQVIPLINQIVLAPLSEIFAMPTEVRYDEVPVKWEYIDRPNWTPDATYWATLRRAIDECEIDPSETALISLFRQTGLGTSDDPAIARGLDRALVVGKQLVREAACFQNLGTPLKHGWTLLEIGGRFGTDYLARAAAAESFIYYNLLEDSAYYNVSVDSDFRPLSGSGRYTLHFDPGSLPPADPRAFWSLTAYDDQYFLEQNASGRYNVGTVTELAYGADGSLDLFLQHCEPTEREHLRNWLPVPEGSFELTLRVYMPGSPSNYNPPRVVRVH